MQQQVIGAQSSLAVEQQFLASRPLRDISGDVISGAFGSFIRWDLTAVRSDYYPVDFRVVGALLVMTIDAYHLEVRRPGMEFDIDMCDRMKIEVQVAASRKAYYHLLQAYRLCRHRLRAHGQPMISSLTGIAMQVAFAEQFGQYCIQVGGVDRMMKLELAQ